MIFVYIVLIDGTNIKVKKNKKKLYFLLKIKICVIGILNRQEVSKARRNTNITNIFSHLLVFNIEGTLNLTRNLSQSRYTELIYITDMRNKKN